MTYAHDSDPNLYLVTTYAPLFALLLRAVGLLVCWDVMRQLTLEHAVVGAALAVAVYLDASLWHGTFEQACGCLVVFALALQTHTPPVQECAGMHESAVTTRWAADLLWAALSALQVVAAVFRVNLHAPAHTLKISVSVLFFLAHTALACASFHTSEWMWRMACYFLACALVHFGGRARQFAPHACIHLLFVHVFVVAASVAILVCAHMWLFYSVVHSEAVVPPPAKRPRPPPEPDCEAPDPPPHDDLLLKLRAAKAAAHSR